MPPADLPFASLPTPGPHPATAELRAYAAGTLPPAEQHRLEAHTLECERCADLLAGFSLTDAATTDQAVATLRSRLQARLGTPAHTLPRQAWPRLAAAAAVLGVVATGIWALEKNNTHSGSTVARHTISQAPSASVPAPPEKGIAQPMPPAAAVPPAPETQPATGYAATTKTPGRQARSRRPIAAHRPRSSGSDRRKRTGADQKIPGDQATALADAQIITAGTARADSAPSAARVASLSPASRDSSFAKKSASFDTIAPAARPMAASTESSAGTAQATATPLPPAPTVKPGPVGGSAALRDYLRREAVRFDSELNASHISGAVRLRFVVGADGKLSNMQVVRGLRADYDAEALRILCDGPAWQPGVAGGRRAPLPVEITVLF